MPLPCHITFLSPVYSVLIIRHEQYNPVQRALVITPMICALPQRIAQYLAPFLVAVTKFSTRYSRKYMGTSIGLPLPLQKKI